MTARKLQIGGLQIAAFIYWICVSVMGVVGSQPAAHYEPEAVFLLLWMLVAAVPSSWIYGAAIGYDERLRMLSPLVTAVNAVLLFGSIHLIRSAYGEMRDHSKRQRQDL